MQTIQIRITKELLKKAQDLADSGIYSNKSEVIRDALRRLVFNKIKTSKQREFIILFSSDLHGNLVQYKKLFKKASDDRVNAVIIGGDIAPKDAKHRTIKDQGEFLKKNLIPIIDKFNKNNKKKNIRCRIFLMMGNDDFKANYAILQKYEKKGFFKLINEKCIKIHENFKIAGYSYVPLTPFKFKDWEKLDLNNQDESKTRKGFITEGVKSKKDGFIKYKFDLKKRKNTIENDLNQLLSGIDNDKLVLVTHAPPYMTALDMHKSSEHVGSAAIKKIILEKKPLISLHGHVHETVDMSGSFMEIINKTTSICSANDHIGDKLAVIKFNIYNPRQAVREII